MLLELVILGGAIWTGYKSWEQQEKNHSNAILAKQEASTEAARATRAILTSDSPSRQIPLVSKHTRKRSHLDISSAILAICLSGFGVIFYYPLNYVALPFLLYPIRRKLVAAWRVTKQGRVDLETLTMSSILGSILGQQVFISSLLSMTQVTADMLAARVMKDSHHDLVDVFQDLPEKVWAINGDTEILVPLLGVAVGDILVVSAGEIIPVDGTIISGVAGIDQHHFTGEAIPVEKSKDEEVFALTLVVSGKIYIRVAKTSGESSATKIADILNHTTEYKSFTVLRAERFSRQLVKPTFITSAIALPILGFNSAVGVILCHPKERLKIAAPISLLRYLKRGIDEGILIKDGRSLELFNQVDTIVFDKTGTLTEAQPSIGEIYSYTGLSADEILRYAAIAEHRQTHPLAKAILQEARARELSLDQPTHSEYLLGYGVKIIIENCVVLVGSRCFMESENISMKDSAAQLESHCAEQGRGVVMVALDGRLIGAIALVPTIRAEAKEVMAKLKQLKQIKKTYIISGDAEAPTQQLAHELGIDGYFAQTLPQRKAELIKELQQQGAFVCFIGDGINDAIAMKQAQVSVSLNGASQLATDTAQILFMDQGIRHLPRLFELAKGYHSHMNNQLTIVLGCSILGISSVFLGGWGMGNMMVLNMLSILGTLGYSAMDRTPPTQMDKHHLQKNQLILQKPPPIDAVNILPLTTLGD